MSTKLVTTGCSLGGLVGDRPSSTEKLDGPSSAAPLAQQHEVVRGSARM